MIDIDAIKQEISSSDDSLAEAEKILFQVKIAVEEVIAEKYVKIKLVTNEGNISHKLEQRYGWHAEWHGRYGYTGENTLYVPKDKCTKALLAELKEYDEYLGNPYPKNYGIDWFKRYPTID